MDPLIKKLNEQLSELKKNPPDIPTFSEIVNHESTESLELMRDCATFLPEDMYETAQKPEVRLIMCAFIHALNAEIKRREMNN